MIPPTGRQACTAASGHQHASHAHDVRGHEADVVPVAVGPAAAVPTHQHRGIGSMGRAKDVIAVQPVRAVGHIALDIDARCVKRACPAHDCLSVIIRRLKRHGHLAVGVGFKRQGHVQSAKKSKFNHT